jgi:hypothetical protein
VQGVTQGAYAIIICSPSGALAPSRCRCAVGRGRSGARASRRREPVRLPMPFALGVRNSSSKYTRCRLPRVSLIKAVELHLC